MRKTFNFRFRSAEHWIEMFRSYYGPTHKAFAALEETRQKDLHASLQEFLGRWNARPGSTLVIPGEYLEAVITK